MPDFGNKTHGLFDLTSQIDLLTNSLSGSEIASTPASGELKRWVPDPIVESLVLACRHLRHKNRAVAPGTFPGDATMANLPPS